MKKLILIFFLGVGLAIGSTSSLYALDDSTHKESVRFANSLSQAFEHVAKAITPSLVSISSVKKMKRPAQLRRFQGRPNDPMKEFFGERFFERFFPDQGRPRPQQGLGTGFVLDDKGHILTNNHVIEGADEVKVKLSDDRSFEAEIIGTDPRTDLAVLRIKAKNLQPVQMGDSTDLKIGEWVVAAGNPFGLDNTITAGIVSAKGRSIMRGMQYEDFIQTDAAINPGNSGGPLVNLQGEVVGINSAIFTRSGGYMGIGFAIPVNMAKNVFQSLISEGRVVRGWLGVAIQDLTDDLAESFEFEGKAGALVGDVSEDSPAAEGGLESGDIITHYNGKKIKHVNHLRNMVAETKPSTSVSVKVFRDGRAKKLSIKIGELKQDQASIGDTKEDINEDVGLRVETLTPELQKRLGIETDYGVVVAEVAPYSLAAEAGLQVKDLVLKVNSTKVKNTREFYRALENSDLKKGVRLIVESSGMKRFVFLRDKAS